MPHRPIRTLVATQRIITAPPDTLVTAAACAMKAAKVGALLVVENGKLAGIFTERDALFRVLAEGLDPAATPLSQVMTANPQTIGADKPFGHAMHMMFEGGFRHVPVVDNGRPVGMVSARDALGPEMEAFESELRQREEISEILG